MVLITSAFIFVGASLALKSDAYQISDECTLCTISSVSRKEHPLKPSFELALYQRQASYLPAHARHMQEPFKAFDSNRTMTMKEDWEEDLPATRVGSRAILLRRVSVSRRLSFAILSIGVVAMLFSRIMQYLFENSLVCTTVFVVDVLVWYFATVVYLTTSQEIARTSGSDLVIGACCFVQVFAGSALLPLADIKSLGNVSWRVSFTLFWCVACAFFYASYFALDALAHGGILVVSNIRALEPLSTTFLMVMFGGETLSCTQYVVVILAIFGVGLSTYDSSFADQFTSGAVSIILVLILANFCYSLRNVILHHARDLVGKNKITLFVACCAMAPFPAFFSLGPILAATEDRLDAFPNLDLNLLGTSVASFVLYNLASFLVLMSTSPTTHAMLLIGKRIVTVIMACALVHEWPTWLQLAGLSITAVAVKLFESGKSKEAECPDVKARDAQIVKANHFKEFVSSPPALAACAFTLCFICTGVAICMPEGVAA